MGTSQEESAGTYALNLGLPLTHPLLLSFFWGGGFKSKKYQDIIGLFCWNMPMNWSKSDVTPARPFFLTTTKFLLQNTLYLCLVLGLGGHTPSK